MSRGLTCKSGFSIGAVCVAATAVFAAPTLKASDVAGRWHSDRIWELSRVAPDCEEGKCGLTLDIVACGNAWCGIMVNARNDCGETALKFDAGKAAEQDGGVLFSGSLQLAKGSEPYVLQAYLEPASEGAPVRLAITGDTGGEFRVFRRSFPFHADLARSGDATCKLEKPVS